VRRVAQCVGLLLGVGALAAHPAVRADAPATPTAPSADRPQLARERPSRPKRGAQPDLLESFHRALQRSREQGAKTHVLFFGDSHTAADYMTGRVRERLQAEYGDGGPGFLITGQPWRFYRHARAELVAAHGVHSMFVRKRPASESVPLGLAGVVTENGVASSASGDAGVEASEPAAPAALPVPPLVRLKIQPALEPRGRATHYELFYLQQPGGAGLEVALDGRAQAQLSTRAEQTRPGYLAFDSADDQSHELSLRADSLEPLSVFGVVAELQGAGVVLDTLGVPGARARAQLYWDQALFAEHVRRREPDLWVLAYGTNESMDVTQPIDDYASQLRQVVSQLRATLPGVSCALVGPTDYPEKVRRNVYQPRQRAQQINQLERSVAAANGCVYVDLIEAMGGPLGMLRWRRADPPLGGKDLVHFTRKGYELLGDRIADALLGLPSTGPIRVKAEARGPAHEHNLESRSATRESNAAVSGPSAARSKE
jgi:lysophospholipase L1-like esterase